jgi:hypothetical protein
MDQKWYKNSYRRNLVDMHIHDWNDEFLSKFSVDDYYSYLKTCEVDGVMLYLQSHVGLCHYPTKTGVMHKAFVGKEDMMKRLVDKCRANGIPVVGYYSLIFNTIEEEKHPEWRLISDRKTGTSYHQRGSRYGRCCPNNPEYREFLKAQIKELIDYFELDGVFYDMTYWSGVCYCESCRKRFEAETGLTDLPDMDDLSKPEAKLFREKRDEWIAEFCKFVTDYTHELAPTLSVSHNNAHSVEADWKNITWEGVSDCCDYCCGDIYGDIYDNSFCIKYFQNATKNMPVEYMVSRFAINLKQHTLSKSQTYMDQSIFLTVAHHGANFVIDAMDPVGTLNMKVAKLIGNAYRAQMPYEKYIKSGESVGDVAIWYSTTGRYNSGGQDYHSGNCSNVLSKTLATHHVPYKITPNTKSNELGQYKVVLAPAIAGISDANREDIYRYVREGGVFYFSGAEDEALLREFFDAEYNGLSSHKYTYVSPIKGNEKLFFGFDEKYPLAMLYKHPIVKVGAEAEVLAYLNVPYGEAGDSVRFASIHSNPPGILTEHPSVVRRKYGKGTVIWSALPIEGDESYHHREITMRILREYLPECEQTVTTTAPMQVELVTFADENAVQVSALDMGVTEERRNIESFEISVATDKCPKRVLLLPDESELAFTYDNGRATFKTRALDIFDMYRIEF